jgi:hypothetical protein
MAHSDWPLLSNSHDRISEAYAESLDYLKNHESMRRKLTETLWAYHEIGDLIPQTVENIGSGHYFPYSESYRELENSFMLCLEGYYRYSYTALRSVVELGILGVYFAVLNKEHVEVKPWLTSTLRTPSMKIMLDRLEELASYKLFNNRFGFRNDLVNVYDELGASVHVRGYRNSSTGHNRVNANSFSEKSLLRYSKFASISVEYMLEVLLLKYPIGMQPIPVDEKFGLNGPVGGFLQAYQHETIFHVLPPDKRAFLKELSDKDESVKEVTGYFESLPDISSEELQRQEAEFHSTFRGKTEHESEP